MVITIASYALQTPPRVEHSKPPGPICMTEQHPMCGRPFYKGKWDQTDFSFFSLKKNLDGFEVQDCNPIYRAISIIMHGARKHAWRTQVAWAKIMKVFENRSVVAAWLTLICILFLSHFLRLPGPPYFDLFWTRRKIGPHMVAVACVDGHC